MNIFRFIFFISLVVSLPMSAQISGNGNASMGEPPLRSDLIDTVIVFDNAQPDSITWNPATPGSFVWVHYVNNDYAGTSFTTDTVLQVANATSSTLADAQEGGYIITHITPLDTVVKVVWVVRYDKHPPLAIDTVLVEDPGPDSLFDPCNTLYLSIETTQDSFFYYAPPSVTSGPLRLQNFVHYTAATPINDGVVSVDAPLKDGPLKVSAYEVFVFSNGVSSNFGTTEGSSAEYTAIAIKSEIEVQFSGTENPPTNEIGNMDQQGKQYSVSIPKEMTLSTSSNDPLDSYDWNIYKITGFTPNLVTTYDASDFSFPLNNADTFMVTMAESNGTCHCSDSITVIAYETLLAAPNVFTPNGDGINDEFKVSYRSIKSFEGTIYSRWGKKVFSWKNPAEGWDGKINGADAAPGAYFYKITATGSRNGHDVSQTISGDINLIRPK